MENNKIAKGIIGYSVSTWANLFLGLLYVVLSTRIITPNVYGLISLFYTIATVLMYVLSLGLDSAYLRYYNDPPLNDTRQQMLYKCMVISTVVCIVACFLCIVLIPSIIYSIFGYFSRVLIGILFLYTFCQLILRYLNITFRMSFKTLHYNVQNIVMNGVSKLVVVVAALIHNNFIFIISVLSTGILLVLVTYLFLQKDEYRPISDNENICFLLKLNGYKAFFRFAFFSSPTYIVTYSNLYLGQQIVASCLGAYALGIFASTSIFSQIITSVRNGFATYWTAFVYKSFNDEKHVICKMHDYILAFSILVVCFLALSRDFIYIFIGKGFHESKAFFSLMMIMPILGFVQETTDKGILLMKKNEIVLMISIFAVIMNISVSMFLINKLGIVGAAIGNASSALFTYICSTFWGQKLYKTILSLYKSIFGVVLVIAILVIPSLFTEMYVIVLFVSFLFLLGVFLFLDEYSYMIKALYSLLKGIRL